MKENHSKSVHCFWAVGADDGQDCGLQAWLRDLELRMTSENQGKL